MSVLITAQALTQAGASLTLASGGTLGHSTALLTFDNTNDTVKVNNFLGFANAKGLTDSNNNELILFNVAGSAANYLQVSNADPGSGPKVAALGDDTDIDLDLDPKGSGGVNVGKNNSGTAGKITLFDGSSNGVSLASPSSMSGTTAYTLPTGYPASSGYVLASTTAGVMSWETSPAVTYISDADGDTKVTTESSPDEDKIRFDTAGAQRMLITDDGKVGIGVAVPSRSLDVSGDVKVRGGDILGSHASLPAVQIDGSSNVTIPQNLTVTGTVGLNGVDYTFPASDGSSGQFLSTNSSGGLSWATASGGGGSESTLTLTFEYDNTVFDSSSTATTLSDTIPANKEVTAIKFACTEAFVFSDYDSNGAIYLAIDDVYFGAQGVFSSYGSPSLNSYMIQTSTGEGTIPMRLTTGSSAAVLKIYNASVTNDTTSYNYITDGTFVITIYYK